MHAMASPYVLARRSGYPAGAGYAAFRRCRRCDASEHATRDCRDPVTCDRCGRSRHRAHECHYFRPRTAYTTTSPSARSHHVRAPTPPSMAGRSTSSTSLRFGPAPAVVPLGGSRDGRLRGAKSPPGLPDVQLPGSPSAPAGSRKPLPALGSVPQHLLEPAVVASSPSGCKAISSPLACIRAQSTRLRSIIEGSLDLDFELDAPPSTNRGARSNPPVLPPPFADVLMACPAMDVCAVLASEQCYMLTVVEALSEENERAGLGLLLMQGEDGDHDDVLLARPKMDMCCVTATQAVLASRRCYMECVDGALAEENDRVGTSMVLASKRYHMVSMDVALSEENARANVGQLLLQGVDGDHDAFGLEVHMLLPSAMTGEVLLRQVSCPPLACSPLLTGHDPLLSPGAGLTTVLSSPGDALCDGGFCSDSDDDEAVDGEMQQLLPCLAALDQQEMLLDGEEVAHEDGLVNSEDLVTRECQPVADVINADAEATMIGNLLAADTGDDTDDDDVDAGGTAPSSGTVIRCVADLFSLPAVPLLPTPIPPMSCAPVIMPACDRRSSRLATKPQLSAHDKAQRVLHKKMGLDFGDMPLVKATKEFANTCKSPFSASAIEGLNTLFRLKLPSMTAIDEALIGLAGPGGCDFPQPTVLDVPA